VEDLKTAEQKPEELISFLNSLKRNRTLRLLNILIILLVIFLFFYFLKSSKNKISPINISPSPVACTMEAKQCPDGSYVSRTGPKCEFSPCPSSQAPQGKPTSESPTKPQESGKEQGTLAGKISIGPLCPVEPCPTNSVANPYLGKELILKSQTGTSTSIKVNEDGSFSGKAEPGTYSLSLNECNYLGCNQVLPKTIKIEPNLTTQEYINIDMGIR